MAGKKPKQLKTKFWRKHARLTRDFQWEFMNRIKACGTLWFCIWNKNGRKEMDDELRCCLMDGIDIQDWMNRHRKWFLQGKWNEERYAWPIRLTKLGRAALAERTDDMTPVYGGLVEPGYFVYPNPPTTPPRSPQHGG